MACRMRRGVAAVTLVEALCTLAILGVMMSAMFGVLSVTLRSVERTRERLRSERVVSGIGRCLRRDLHAASGARTDKVAPLTTSDTIAGSGATLSFFTTRPLTAHVRSSPSGLWRVRYVVRSVDDETGAFDLMRAAAPYTVGKDIDWGSAAEERLARGLAEWRLRFHDGSEWVDAWQRPKLPCMVRVDVRVEGGEDEADRSHVLYFRPMVTPEINPLP